VIDRGSRIKNESSDAATPVSQLKFSANNQSHNMLDESYQAGIAAFSKRLWR
jgi:hypothetical protein